MKLGKKFYHSSLGDFYYDEETNEVTVRVQHEGEVYHEWRGKPEKLIYLYTDAIDSVVFMIVVSKEESIEKQIKRTD